MFINFSNHPSARWSESQRKAAESLGGEIVDMAFPAVPSTATTAEVEAMAAKAVADITALNPDGALVQGEMTLVYNVVNALKQRGVPVFAACSERRTVETVHNGQTEKTSVFEFVQFRAY